MFETTLFFSIFNVFFNLFFKERERANRGGAEGAGEIESQAGSTLSVQSLMWSLNLQTMS